MIEVDRLLAVLENKLVATEIDIRYCPCFAAISVAAPQCIHYQQKNRKFVIVGLFFFFSNSNMFWNHTKGKVLKEEVFNPNLRIKFSMFVYTAVA